MDKRIKIIILLLILIIGCSIIGGILAKYRSEAITSKEIEVAYYVLENKYQTQQLKLDYMVPRDEPYKFGIVIANFKENKVAETAIEYTIQIRTTTNLPLQFALKRQKNEENKIIHTQMDKNEDGVYYITMKTDLEEFGLNKEEHMYDLEITFPKEYRINSEYADIIELVEVMVDSKQKI